ncbi:MAG: twin-arginine translocase TatA/TatE family subunit [Croceibacterium sp.]
MSLGPFQILIVAMVILVLFGRGRISEMMGDFGKGVKSFRQGLNEDDKSAAPQLIEGAVHEAKPASEAASDPRPAAD